MPNLNTPYQQMVYLVNSQYQKARYIPVDESGNETSEDTDENENQNDAHDLRLYVY